MLTVLKILALAYAWFALPALTGVLWKLFRKKEYNSMIHAYLTGMITIWAIFFAVARYAIVEEMRLSELSLIWMIVLVLLSLILIVFLFVNRERGLRKFAVNAKMLPGIFLMLGIIAVTVGFSVNEREEHTVEAVMTMYATDTLYEYSPMNGKEKNQLLAIEAERLEQQAQSPIDACYAVYASMVKINPAKFVRILLPAFLLPFYFCVYAAWGKYFFAESAKKRYLFQTVVWLLHGMTLITERAVVFNIFANCWYGETLFFLGLLPAAVLLLLGEKEAPRKLSDFKEPYLIGEYVVCAAAGQLLYAKGFFFVTFVWGIALIAAWIKRWKDGSSITAVER